MTLHAPRFTRAAANDATILVVILGFASVVELAILRTFTRTAIHVPALEQLQEPYEWVASAGRYAYFVSVGLVFPALAILATRMGALKHPSRWLAIVAIGAFSIASLGAAAELAPIFLLDAVTIWAVALLAIATASSVPRPVMAVPLAAFAIAFGLSGAYTALPDAGAGQPSSLLDGAELAGLTFAISLPLLVARPHDRAATIAGVAVTAFALAFFLGNGSTSRFLLLWNVGLSGTLPGVAYAAAAGAIAFSGVQFWRSGSPLAASGVLLLVAGGIGLQSSYQSALAIAGIAALYLEVSEKGPRESATSAG